LDIKHETIEERAKLVFSLGSMKTAIAIVTVMLTLMWGVNLIYAKDFIKPALFTVSIALMTLSANKSSSFMNVRRSLWASIIIIAPQLIAQVILTPIGLERYAYTLLYTSMYLAGLVAMIMDNKIAKYMFMASPIIPSIHGGLTTLTALSTAIISLILTKEVIKRIMFIGEDIIKPAAHLLIDGNPKPLEEVLEKLAPEGEVQISTIKGEDITLITANFHPGPLIAGSSNAPAKIMKRLEEIGFKPLFLRAASTHSEDIPSQEEVEKVIVGVEKCIEGVEECKCGKFVVRNEGEYEITAQKFGKIVLTTVSGRGFESFEDIPNTTEKRLNEILNAKGMNVKAIVIDRHDSLNPGKQAVKVKPFSKEEDKLIEALLKAIEEAIQRGEEEEVYVGYSSRSIKRGSIGSGGIRAVTIGGAAYISFDSNNMTPELRDAISEIVRSEGYHPIIATTDTHETVGPREAANPIGINFNKKDYDEIIETIKGIIREAKGNSKKMKLMSGTVNVRVKMVGEEVMNSIIKRIEVANYIIPLILMGIIPAQIALLTINI
jgi:predicted neutral ceramidase superfamily lipid hydrolase